MKTTVGLKMTENEGKIAIELLERLRTVIDEVQILNVYVEEKSEEMIFDGIMDVSINERQWRLLLEVKSRGEPRLVREAINYLKAKSTNYGETLGIVGAPWLSPRSREICNQEGVGYIDLAGNCRIVFESVYIDRQGFENPAVERRSLRNLFSQKSSRVIRVLLENPNNVWRMESLANQAQVSLGTVARVKERLLDLEFGRFSEDGISLSEPESLLKEWGKSYSLRRSKFANFFGMGDTRELEAKLIECCNRKSIRYALTLFSGADRVSPFMRYSRAFAYIDFDPNELANELDWEAVNKGMNISLIPIEDEMLLYDASKIAGVWVVSNIQLYLDLVKYKGRGEEAAAYLLENRIREQW